MVYILFYISWERNLTVTQNIHVQTLHWCYSNDNVNTLAAKAHARACLIHKCFIPRDAVTLTRTFLTYVHPILEYASVI